jgi:hypothetical protein
MSHKKPYFKHRILSFYAAQTTSRYFMEGLCAHVACEDAHTNFRLENFDILKCVKDAFQIKGSICTQEPKHHSRDTMSSNLLEVVDISYIWHLLVVPMVESFN